MNYFDYLGKNLPFYTLITFLMLMLHKFTEPTIENTAGNSSRPGSGICEACTFRMVCKIYEKQCYGDIVGK